MEVHDEGDGSLASGARFIVAKLPGWRLPEWRQRAATVGCVLAEGCCLCFAAVLPLRCSHPSLPAQACCSLARLFVPATEDDSSEDELGGEVPGSPLTQDVLQQQQQALQQRQRQQQQQAPPLSGGPPKSGSSRGGGSWLRGGRGAGSAGGAGEGSQGLDDASDVISLGDWGADTVSWPRLGVW